MEPELKSIWLFRMVCTDCGKARIFINRKWQPNQKHPRMGNRTNIDCIETGCQGVYIFDWFTEKIVEIQEEV